LSRNRGKEAIAHPGDSFDDARRTGRVPERLAQARNALVQSVIKIDSNAGRPDSIPEFITADDLSGAFEQHYQDLVGLLLQPDAHTLSP
jgi:hypothetical protein